MKFCYNPSMILRTLIFLSCLTTTAFAAPVQVNADYAIYGGGMKLIDAKLKIHVDDKEYDAALNAHTTGFISRLFEWWNNITSKGNVQPRLLQPTQHISENSWLGDRRSVTLIYNGKGGFVKKDTYPAPAAEDREEVRHELTQNTQDLMSAALTLLQRVAKGESCNQTLAVYDGRRRFNLKFSDAGTENLSPVKYNIHSGTARRCEMTIERVAGYWKKYQTEWTEDGDAKMRLTFWLAPLQQGGPEIPVRARTYGEFGSVFVHLTGGTANGENLMDWVDNKPLHSVTVCEGILRAKCYE